jgi:hypothetical protein
MHAVVLVVYIYQINSDIYQINFWWGEGHLRIGIIEMTDIY